MEVILIDKFYGYCPGLKTSIELANNLAKKALSEKCMIYCDVPLAHNAEVTSRLHKRGVVLVENISTIQPYNDYFLVSAHGASKKRQEELGARGFKVVDGVCPRVKSVQDRAIKDMIDGYEIIIFGKPDHAEVVGINESINNQALIIKKIEDAVDIKLSKKTSLISQTTYPEDKFDELFQILKTNNPQIEIIQRKTTCPIVVSRVNKILEYIEDNAIDKVIVVGSPTSSNTKLIAAKVQKTTPARMIADARSIRKEDIKGFTKVLVVSGTSAPPEVVEKVANKIKTMV